MQKHKMYIVFLFSIFSISLSFSDYSISLGTSRTIHEPVINFTLTGYTVKPVVVKGEKCDLVSLENAASFGEKGFPALPYVTQSIVIPNDAAIDFDILDIQYKEINVKKLVPSKGVIYRNQDPSEVPYTFDKFYSQDTWYPENSVTLSDPFIVRDVRGVTVCFQPFQYNPIKGILKIAQSMSIRIKSIGPGKINILKSPKKEMSPSFNTTYKRRFLNYQKARTLYPEVADGDRMIIISTSDYADGMSDLVTWKNQKGIKTDIFEYPSETGGSGYESLKNFIKKKLDDENITYFLLVGDAEDIPAIPVETNVVGDPSYCLLSGNDEYPDAFIGRFSVNKPEELHAMVNKVIKYEKEPDPNGEWYHKATGIASDKGPSSGGPKDKELMENYRTDLLAYNYTEVDQFYDPGAKTDDVIEALNEGRSWLNYMGHGSVRFWMTSDFDTNSVHELQNNYKSPVIIAVACKNGVFNNETCLAEVFTRKQEKGALVFAGATKNQEWISPQVALAEMVKLLTSDKYLSVGAIFYNGEMEMLENGEWPKEETFKIWNYFGDPSVQHYTNTPKELNVTCPSKVDVGQQEITVGFGEEISGRVCIYSNEHGILASKIVENALSAKLSCTVSSEKELLLTVTGFNKIPVQKSISVGTVSVKNSSKVFSAYTISYYNSQIWYTVPELGNEKNVSVMLNLYSAQGKLVTILVDETKICGKYLIDLNNGIKQLASGVYICEIKAGGFCKSIKVFKR